MLYNDRFLTGVKFNYSQICSTLLKSLPERQKTILSRRFALENNVKRETLQAIGESYNLTRERVRQVERDGFLRLKPLIQKYQKAFQYFENCIQKYGDLKKEDLFLEELGGKKWKNQVYFLLNLEKNFERFGETNEFYSFWALANRNSPDKAKKIVALLYENLKRIGKPVSFEELTNLAFPDQKVSVSFVELSKKIQKNHEGLWGLSEWPEIRPRGTKDKAYLVFKKEKRPLHFKEVASLIEKALPQTVHNELIKDSRFVLVGRGIYALREWGYEDGFVKDIILKILKEAKKPLTKEEILNKVLCQRLVKNNTVFLNLSNKKYFSKISESFYTIREA